jgi:hypothetical protein
MDPRVGRRAGKRISMRAFGFRARRGKTWRTVVAVAELS